MKIAVFSRNIMPRDAVGNFARGLARMLLSRGYDARLYARDTISEWRADIAKPAALAADLNKDDVLFCSYSIYDEDFERYSLLECRKILYFHNVTPPHWFAKYSGEFSKILERSWRQIRDRRLVMRYDALVANSRFSLGAVKHFSRRGIPKMIHPPFFNFRLSNLAPEPIALPETRFHLLWVGRFAPHKRPELAVKICARLVDSGVDVSLALVGNGREDFQSFKDAVDERISEISDLASRRICFLDDVSDNQLAWLYENSDLLLSTSAHEGYYMPISEAAAFALPVAAMPQPAIIETLNGGGILLEMDTFAAAERIRVFLENASDDAREAAIPKHRPLPTERLLNIIDECLASGQPEQKASE